MKWLIAIVLALPAHAIAAPAPSEPITFRDAIKRALEHNTDLRVALDDVMRTEGLLEQARSALLPQINGSAIYTHLPGNEYIAGQRTAAEDGLLVSATLGMPLVDLRAWANKRRASDQVAVDAATANSVRRDIAIETARAYFAAFVAARYVDIAKAARDTAQAHLDVTKQRRTAGVESGLDLSRAQSELATDQAQVDTALTSRVRAEQALGVITGTDHALSAADEPDLGDPNDPSAGPGISHRADVIAAATATFAATRSRRADWTEWTPTLHLDGDIFYTAPALFPGMPQEGYELQLTLTVPIYDGGFRAGLHMQRRALELEAAEREVGVDRQANADVVVADSVLGQARDARNSSRQAADLTHQTLELALEGYRAGTSSSLEVVDAQRADRDAALQALIADNDFREAQLDLLAATGAFPRP